MNTTRAEHLTFCKARALRELGYYIERDLPNAAQNAFVSIASDLGKHPETAGHLGIQLGLMQMLAGLLRTPEQMRRFIEGFN